MQYLVNIETGYEREIVYFKHNNQQILTEHVDGALATGNYRVEEREEL